MDFYISTNYFKNIRLAYYFAMVMITGLPNRGSFAVEDETTNAITKTLLKILEWNKYWK